MGLTLLSLGLVLAIVAIMLVRLVTQLRALTTQAHTDPLTGAFNRRHLESCLAVTIARRNRTGEPASLLLFDVDHFKQINDTSGHAAGDEVLKTLVTIVAKRARTLDGCFRIGGDEFVLLLPATRYGGAVAVAEDIRALIASAAVLGGRGVSISVGVSDLQSGHTASTWLEDADAALFEAKQGGRNRIAGRTLATERDRRAASQSGWRPSRSQQGEHPGIH
jgi:diguanylate cyclase (GGDEF)-like protein